VVKPKRTKRVEETTTAKVPRREKRLARRPAQNINAPRPSGTGTATKKAPGQTTRTATLPRTPRASAVTVTLSGGAGMSYADVLAQAREKISLEEMGVERVEMRKAMTGAIIIRVPGDKGGDKASKLAAKLTETLDRSAVRIAALLKTAELRVEGIDVSVMKEELRHILALAAGCKKEELQVGGIGVARGGLGSAWMRCPIAGARKLAQEEKVAIGWSWARVTAIPKRLLQCFRCLELGHVSATCTSAEDRANLCYRCGKSGHKARGCTAAKPNCPLCESLGEPAGHRMGEVACAPRQKSERRWKQRGKGTTTTTEGALPE
jgi:hypothetical protein